MTWIVKATGGYEYVSEPDGDIFAPELSDAHRYTNRSRAARVAAKLNRVMLEGKPYRVVRLRRKVNAELRERIRELTEIVIWMSGSADFARRGTAGAGWSVYALPKLNAHLAWLAKHPTVTPTKGKADPMTASEELRALLENVASGKTQPDVALAAIAQWMVLVTGAIKEVPVEALMKQSALYVRNEAATICDRVGGQYRSGSFGWTVANKCARRIRDRGDTLSALAAGDSGSKADR